MISICYLVILFINLLAKSEQHGALIEPPSRNAAWFNLNIYLLADTVSFNNFNIF